ncbi:MAG TPA: UdgX family uracil-DNA binding protein [Actinomycetes bacterium]
MTTGAAVDGAAAFVPTGVGLDGLRVAAVGCRGCELFEGATQTVFSAGSATARVALVGEQPGDVEDRRGLPFVGPAGQLLDRAMTDAGLDRASAYVTNAVKHFRFRSQAGGRRIHQTPDLAHLTACAPWLRAELSIVDPLVVVLLGATAGKALLGPSFRVTAMRGRLLPRAGWADEPAAVHSGWFLATTHPSAVLRADDREAAYAALVSDLRTAAAVLGGSQPAGDWAS